MVRALDTGQFFYLQIVNGSPLSQGRGEERKSKAEDAYKEIIGNLRDISAPLFS